MSFKDYATAARFRDLLEEIVEEIINRKRPLPRVGTVYDFDLDQGEALVLFPGDAVPLPVSFNASRAPSRRMLDAEDGTAEGDVVRVVGNSGGYYIDEVQEGTPAPVIYNYPGQITMSARPVDPPGYLRCNGGAYDPDRYPALFDAIGDTYGTQASTGLPLVPNLEDRFPVGAGGVTRLGGSTPDTLDGFNLAQMHAHVHDHAPAEGMRAVQVEGHTHGSGNLLANPTQATPVPRTSGDFFASHAEHTHGISGNTGPGGGHRHEIEGRVANSGNGPGGTFGHPRTALHFLIKT